MSNRQCNTWNRDQYSTAPSFSTGAATMQQRAGDGAFTRYNEDGSFAYDTSQGISNLGFSISASKDFGSQLQNSLSQGRSEEHTSELKSLMRISYAVFCLTKKI